MIRRTFRILVLVLATHYAIGQAPVVNGFSPQSGPLASKVTITGSNFSATPLNNIVYFGAVRGVVTSASATSLTAVVPLGATYDPITVTVNSLTAYAATPFVVTKSIIQPLTGSSFSAHHDIPVTSATTAFSVVDFDFNGSADVAMSDNIGTAYNFAVFRNTTDCKNLTFNVQQNFFTNHVQPEPGTASGDFDGDGRIEAVISEPGNKTVAVFPNLSYAGTVSLSNGIALTAVTLATGDVKVADMDGDGRPDIVVATINSLLPNGGVAVYRNTSATAGSYTFAAPQSVAFLANPAAVALADLDGDGKPEVIITDGIGTVHIRRNKSSAGTLDNTSFDTEVSFVTPASPQEISTGDLDGDGKNDLAVACAGAVTILRNTSSVGAIDLSSFAAHVDFTVNTSSVDLGDLNGDGKADIAVSNGSNVSVFQNQATAGSITASSFSARSDFSIGTASVNQVEIADINSDGYLDIAVTQTGNFFSVFLYNPPTNPAPLITSFSPGSGVVNTPVTIKGANFGTTASANKVYFGAVAATITSASATELVVSVPAYATFAPVTVENLTYNLVGNSLKSFQPLFDNNKDFGGRIIPGSMAAHTDLKIGTSNAGAVNLGDLDGDGFSDILVAGASNDSIIIYRNKGNKIAGPAGFEKSGIYFDTDGNGEILARDLDGDGKLDLVMQSRGVGDQDIIMIYHNESTPGTLNSNSFGPLFRIYLGYLHINNVQINIADMDGDGKLDLVSQNFGNISVFKNNSEPGSFCFAPSVDIPASGVGISIGDIDGDGKPDIATAHGYYGLPGFLLIQNKSTIGSLSFGTGVSIAPPGTGQFNNVEIADLDSDGKPDISWVGPLASSGNLGLHVMHNISTAGTVDATSLASEVTYYFNNSGIGAGTFCRVADINGDGRPDVVVGSGSIGIFENASKAGVIDASSFLNGVAFEIPVNYSAQYPVIGDLDGDGKPEVITTVFSYASNVVSIFRNETYPAPHVDFLKIGGNAVQSGAIGASLTTAGDYQFTNSQSPSVRFGAVASPVTSPSNTSVTTLVPPGTTTEKVAVTLHGLTGFSAVPFSTTFTTNGTLDATTFGSGIDFSLITGSTAALAVNDFDNDGKPDVAAGDGGAFHIFRSNLSAAGADIDVTLLSSLPNFGSGFGTLPAAAGDFDGDGLVDLMANSTIYHNNSGTQALPISFEPGVQGMYGTFMNGGRAKTNIDFNHDGKTDFVSDYTSGNVYVNENLTRKGPFTTLPFSSFGPAVAFNAAGNLGEVSAGDFDGDGYDDIAYLSMSSNQLQTMLNTGLNRQITAASFAAPQSSTTNASPRYLLVADYNADGKLDIAVGYSAIAVISVFQNTSTIGAISFTKQDVTSLANTTGLDASDLDGDGMPEIVTIHSSPLNFSILKNKSTSTISFGNKIDYPLAAMPQGLALADMNLDGKTDILISQGLVVSVFQNNLVSTNNISINTQPLPQEVCAGTTAVFSVVATGVVNISYQWQFSPTQTASFTDITNAGGYTNATTSSLSVNTSANFGAGFYRSRMNGNLATEVITNAVALTIKTCTAGQPPVIATENLSTLPGGTIVLDLIPLITTQGDLDRSSIAIVTLPNSGATASITDGVLTINYAGDSFIGTESITITACDVNGQCATQTFAITISDDIIVYNGVSPDGDGRNDFFIIKNIDVLPTTQNNQVTIYDRWGDEVFSEANYDNTSRVFRGVGKSGSKLPTGTYFYKIYLPDQKRTVRGYISLKN